MNPMTGMPGVTFQEGLNPEVIREKTWTEEYEGYPSRKKISWENSTLAIPLQYGGGFQHPFKIYILNTSSNEQKSFTLLLKDLASYDTGEALMRDVVHVNLEAYAKPSTLFKVMIMFSGTIASKIGELTFN